MGAVAVGLVLGVLAAAPGDLLGLGDIDWHRREAGVEPRVGAVAVGLLGGVAAGAPELLAGLLVDDVRAFLRDLGFLGH